jgi:two-component system, NtrC family, response regulator HydG
MRAPSIFVADDDTGICRLLDRILKPQQYNVDSVQSVSEALRVLAHSSFDVHLLDYHFQDGTGLEIARFLRDMGSDAPIVIITGYQTDDLEFDVNRLNIFRIIKKPFTAQKISSFVWEALMQTRASSRE